MSKMYLTKVSKVDEKHRSPIIIHDGWQWYFAEFQNEYQLNEFLQLTGITITKTEERKMQNGGLFERYDIDYELDNHGHFSNLDQIPDGAKKIKGLSNGSIVDCYFTTNNKVLKVYRPNPNCDKVYKKMPLDEELEYRRNNWYF